jgi:hypothetical protein
MATQETQPIMDPISLEMYNIFKVPSSFPTEGEQELNEMALTIFNYIQNPKTNAQTRNHNDLVDTLQKKFHAFLPEYTKYQMTRPNSTLNPLQLTVCWTRMIDATIIGLLSGFMGPKMIGEIILYATH